MPQTITMADVRRGWIDCQTCGDTLRIFYHHRCPTCHTAFTVPSPPAIEQDSTSETDAKGENANDNSVLFKLREMVSIRARKTDT